MSSVNLEFVGGVATITLNRPDRLNALSVPLAKELAELATAAAESSAEVVVLTGAGRAFCAGGDAQEMATVPDRSGYLDELVREANVAMIALRSIPQPLVAKVNGAVAGAGLGLVLATDVAIAAEDVKFTPAYGAIGLSPDCGATVLLPKAVGERRARELLLTGRRIDAQTAHEWGLVARVATREAFDLETEQLIASIRNSGPLAPTATKALINAQGSYSERLDLERESISRLAGTEFSGGRLEAFAAR